MNKTVIAALLAMALSSPAWADTATDVNNQKAAVQQKYDNEKNSENQSYDQNVSNAKQQYQNNPTQLSNTLNELQIAHSKKMDDLNNNEKMDLQKVSEKNQG